MPGIKKQSIGQGCGEAEILKQQRLKGTNLANHTENDEIMF